MTRQVEPTEKDREEARRLVWLTPSDGSQTDAIAQALAERDAKARAEEREAHATLCAAYNQLAAMAQRLEKAAREVVCAAESWREPEAIKRAIAYLEDALPAIR